MESIKKEDLVYKVKQKKRRQEIMEILNKEPDFDILILK